jgi:hypothetical protein
MAGLVPAIFLFRQRLDLPCVKARQGPGSRAENPDCLSLM